MSIPLLIATRNPGKLREYLELLHGLPYDLLTLDGAGIPEDVEESGETFEENARIKAHAYAAQFHGLTLADDSGLQVDALDGEPGIYSKRYAGENKSDEERIAFLLDKLHDVPENARTGRFVCSIIIAHAAGREWACTGTCEGRIAFAPRGANGFGYDPIFLVAEQNYRLTMAELPEVEKNCTSHRAHAAVPARRILKRLARESRSSERQ